ncbi:MAG: tRNA lysidine(34) synthetase TilS [Odoribacteraceae bacterium]|jgi:tRNA(Ile)-lysidine synthase|nr:tRNA lysidine(34) synthetase TilS [Odoribacteraceae bacterium]
MIDTIKTVLERHDISPAARFIVAVSGGADSIALLHALKYMNREILALHCNFALRGRESDMDEQFVKRFCNTYGIPHSTRRFDTTAHARARGISIEMAARELRYGWFEETRRRENFDYILLAHHADDQAETLLLNLCRGTAIKGLTGMKTVNGRLLRPLLTLARAEIEEYLRVNRLGHREDSSNASLHYSRNKIRHRVIPALREINPAFARAAGETCRALEETERIFLHGIEQLKKEIVSEENGETLIHVQRLLESPAPYTLLFEILRPYGFNAARVEDILRSAAATPGKLFPAGNHLLSRDRDHWRVFNTGDDEDERPVEMPAEGEYRVGRRVLRLACRDVDEGFRPPDDARVACLDLEKLTFPLLARRWREGDRFCPLGMKRCAKKLSDLFTDLKFSARQKRECLILQSGDDIAWVIGHRLDDRFKITRATGRALVVTLEDGLESPGEEP